MYVTNAGRVNYDCRVTPTGRPRSTRDRPAKSPLSEEVIVSAALAILREEGLDAVTMRRVATALDTGPASLYVYVSGRDELRRAMLDRVAGAVPLEDPDPARWREQLYALCLALLRALESHPGIANVAVADPPTTERATRVADNMMGLLLAGGIRAKDAAWALDILPLIVTATAVETAVHQARDHTPESMVQRLEAAFSTLSAQRHPFLAPHLAEMTSGDGDERFQFAIETFVDGLVARAQRG